MRPLPLGWLSGCNPPPPVSPKFPSILGFCFVYLAFSWAPPPPLNIEDTMIVCRDKPDPLYSRHTCPCSRLATIILDRYSTIISYYYHIILSVILLAVVILLNVECCDTTECCDNIILTVVILLIVVILLAVILLTVTTACDTTDYCDTTTMILLTIDAVQEPNICRYCTANVDVTLFCRLREHARQTTTKMCHMIGGISQKWL